MMFQQLCSWKSVVVALAMGAAFIVGSAGCNDGTGSMTPPNGSDDQGTANTDMGAGADLSGDPEAQGPMQPADPDTVTAWLQKGLYKKWACEQTAVSGRSLAHGGKNRICSNGVLSTAQNAPYPVGSIAVLETIDKNGNLTGWSYHYRSEVGDGAQQRYWYELEGASVTTSDFAATGCTSCHFNAANDYTYKLIK